MTKDRIYSAPIYCKSEDEIFAMATTLDGGTACWVWRNGSWISIHSIDVFQDGISLSHEEVISLIGRSAVEALPKRS